MTNIKDKDKKEKDIKEEKEHLTFFDQQKQKIYGFIKKAT